MRYTPPVLVIRGTHPTLPGPVYQVMVIPAWQRTDAEIGLWLEAAFSYVCSLLPRPSFVRLTRDWDPATDPAWAGWEWTAEIREDL